MLHKRSLIRYTPFALQRHVIERCKDINNLPFTGISFGQVQNVGFAGIQPVTVTLEWGAKTWTESDNVDVEVSQLFQQGPGRPNIEVAQAKYRHGIARA